VTSHQPTGRSGLWGPPLGGGGPSTGRRAQTPEHSVPLARSWAKSKFRTVCGLAHTCRPPTRRASPKKEVRLNPPTRPRTAPGLRLQNETDWDRPPNRPTATPRRPTMPNKKRGHNRHLRRGPPRTSTPTPRRHHAHCEPSRDADHQAAPCIRWHCLSPQRNTISPLCFGCAVSTARPGARTTLAVTSGSDPGPGHPFRLHPVEPLQDRAYPRVKPNTCWVTRAVWDQPPWEWRAVLGPPPPSLGAKCICGPGPPY